MVGVILILLLSSILIVALSLERLTPVTGILLISNVKVVLSAGLAFDETKTIAFPASIPLTVLLETLTLFP